MAVEGVHLGTLQVRPLPHRRRSQEAAVAEVVRPRHRRRRARSRRRRRPRRSQTAIDARRRDRRRDQPRARPHQRARRASSTPARSPRDAQAIAKKHKGSLTVTVLDAKKCAELGMGMFLAVGQGSDQEPRFIHMTYKPAKKPKKKICFIGKGVTFDSGGYSLKPSQRDGGHEGRHVRRRRGDLGDGRDRDARLGLRGPRGHRAAARTSSRAARTSSATCSSRWTARRSRSTTPTPKAG